MTIHKLIILIVLGSGLSLLEACQTDHDKTETKTEEAKTEAKSDTLVRYAPEPEKDTMPRVVEDQTFAQKTLHEDNITKKEAPPVKKYDTQELKKVESDPTKNENTNLNLRPRKEKYDKIFPFRHGIAVVVSGGKYGYINQKGFELVEPKYDYAEEFDGVELARVRTRDKVGFVNKTGEEVIPLKYRYVERFNKGLAHARMIDGEQFYIDRQGKHVCDILDAYRDGMARVRLGNQVGYVDTEGRVAVPIVYSYGTHFRDGVAEVKKGEKHFFINKKGDCVKDCQ
ncbi:MAG: WG repeat-containing protein [Microscillaceae bacterium]|jgi:hypothetical protein|nr:WG repeat-containing protein [Microscillaceae bacterium]